MTTMPNGTPSDDFVRQLTRCQDQVYAYIRMLVGDLDASREIMQETNVVLLRKSHQLADGRNFEAWAYKVAFYEVKSYRRDQARERLLFDEPLLRQLASQAELTLSNLDERTAALEDCLKGLHSQQRELIVARYHDGEKVKALAQRFNRTANAVATQLFRIRQVLMDCIDRRYEVQPNS